MVFLSEAVVQTNLSGVKLLRRGKVRDVYDLGDSLLMVATDRVSIFDVVLPTPIAGKGIALTQLSNYWFKQTEGIIENHLIETQFENFPENLRKFPELSGRSVIVKKTIPLPVECIVRGYLSGSGWNEYKQAKSVCGIKLPDGLVESSKLPQPLFTPSTKAEGGAHDENISFEKTVELIGLEKSEKIRDASIRVYNYAAQNALEKGIIIADTKFEFGELNGKIILIDEILTSDSSRYWPLEKYAPGRGQDSFDKQFVRDYGLKLGWNKTYPGPQLPADVVEKTSKKYVQAYEIITGEKWKWD